MIRLELFQRCITTLEVGDIGGERLGAARISDKVNVSMYNYKLFFHFAVAAIFSGSQPQKYLDKEYKV